MEYYEKHGVEFADRTKGVDMSTLYPPFLQLLPAGAHILDAGCGSGRDALIFSQRGFLVTAIDQSRTMVDQAERNGVRAMCMSFREMPFVSLFHGVWACASLLHTPRDELPELLHRFGAALRPGGVMYSCFRCGRGTRSDRGRVFIDYDEQLLEALFRSVPGFTLQKVWRSRDLRPAYGSVYWINLLARLLD